MRFRLLPFTVALAFFIFAVSAYAQDDPLAPQVQSRPIFLGPVFGYNSVTQSADQLATFANDDKCPKFTGGTGHGFYAGFSFEYLIGDKPENSISSVIGRVIYSTYPGSMDVPGREYMSLLEDNTGQYPSGWKPTPSSTKHTVDIKYSVVALEIMYKQNFLKEFPLGIIAGPSIEIPIQKDVIQEFKLVSPLNAQFKTLDGDGNPITDSNGQPFKFSDDKRTAIVKDAPIENANSVRLGFKIGLQYEIIPTERLYIVPVIYYNFSILKVTSDQDWRINLFQAGIDIRWSL